MKLLKVLLKHDTAIINIIAILGGILATWGFIEAYRTTGVDYNFFNSAYSTIRLFGLDVDAPDLKEDLIWQLEVGRWSIVLFMFYYVGKGVMFLVRSQVKLWWLRVSGGGHVIICGAGEKGKTLGLDWLTKHPDTKLFYIEPDETNPNIETLEEAGAVIVKGKAQEKTILERVLIEKASHIVMTTDFDTTNMEIVSTIMAMEKVSQRKTKLPCYVHLLHNEFYDFFLAKQFDAENAPIDVKIFNIYSNAARMIFSDEKKVLGYNLFDTVENIKNPELTYKVAVLGFGKMGENILVHLLQLGHFYNGRPIDVTVVFDQDRDENKNVLDEFTKQYNILNEQYNGHYWNVRFIDDGDFFESAMDYKQIIIGYESEFESLSNLMKLIKRFNDVMIENNVDIALYSNSFENTAAIINSEKTVFNQVRTFGEVNVTCNYDIVINQNLDGMAILNNKHYNELHGYDDKNKTAQQEWQSLSMFLKDSNRYLMEHNKIKKHIIDIFINACKKPGDYEALKKSIESKYFSYPGMKINWNAMGVQNTQYGTHLTEDEIVTLGKVEHKRWNAFHILNGWKELPVPANSTSKIKKDPIRKAHPCITTWEGLDIVSENHQHDYKSDDIETIMRIPSFENISQA